MGNNKAVVMGCRYDNVFMSIHSSLMINIDSYSRSCETISLFLNSIVIACNNTIISSLRTGVLTRTTYVM